MFSKKENSSYRNIPQEETELSDSILSDKPIREVKKRSRSPEPQIFETRRSSVEFNDLTVNFGDFKAVNKLNLSLYKDEIFCFLGHNGAGKTTSLNVLMGKLKPTRGTVQINLAGESLDIRDNAHTAQALMGSCAQHDILFD